MTRDGLHENDTPVVCARCESTFANVGFGDDQGSGCASTHNGKFLSGHYGSMRHDMKLYRVAQPQHIPEGNICDGCIDTLLESGVLNHTPPSPPPPQPSAQNMEELAEVMAEIFNTP